MGDSRPETYSSQESAFVDAENEPAWHDSHVDDPGSAENRPASHVEHAIWPYADDLPASQSTQPSVPAFSPASFVEARPASLWVMMEDGDVRRVRAPETFKFAFTRLIV